MARTASIGIRVEPEVLDATKKAAAADNRSVASLLEKLLKDHLRAAGYLKAEEPGNSETSAKPPVRRAGAWGRS